MNIPQEWKKNNEEKEDNKNSLFNIWNILFLVLGIVLVVAIVLKPFSVSGVCPEVKCGNISLSGPSVVCPNPTLIMNATTPNLTCPTMICNPTYTLNCYGTNSSYNNTYANFTQYDLNTTFLGWFNGTITFNNSMTFIQNGTYWFNITLNQTNYSFEVIPE